MKNAGIHPKIVKIIEKIKRNIESLSCLAPTEANGGPTEVPTEVVVWPTEANGGPTEVLGGCNEKLHIFLFFLTFCIFLFSRFSDFLYFIFFLIFFVNFVHRFFG